MQSLYVQRAKLFSPDKKYFESMQIGRYKAASWIDGFPNATPQMRRDPPFCDGKTIISNPWMFVVNEGPNPIGLPPQDYSSTLSLSEFNWILSKAELGKLLIPQLLDFLKALDISNVFDVRDPFSDYTYPESVKSFSDLEIAVNLRPPSQLEFNIQVEGSYNFGTDLLRVILFCPTVDEVDSAAIEISGVFYCKYDAELGLRGLEKLDPELRYRDEIYCRDVNSTSIRLLKQFNDYLEEMRIASEFRNLTEEEETKIKDAESMAYNLKIEQLHRWLVELGFRPESFDYYNYSGEFNSVSIPTLRRGLERLFDDVDSEKYPIFVCEYLGGYFVLDLLQEEWIPELKDSLVRVRSLDGTLERLVDQTLS